MAVASTRARTNNHLLHHIQPPQRIWNKDSLPQDSPKQPLHDNPTYSANTLMSVPVVYYLSRSGLLDHPHFILVPLSSSHGLFLRDVINRLNLLRGKGMASLYSWSSKRSYKNGYVWQDLEENDLIHPVHGGEYVLKGSQIVELPSSSSSFSKSPETTSSSSSSAGKMMTGVNRRRRNQSWGAIDLHEYQVYKTESIPEYSGKVVVVAADASTQTEDRRRRSSNSNSSKRVSVGECGEIVEEKDKEERVKGKEKVEELSRDEISPPPSDSSPETLESLMKADGRLVLAPSSTSSQALKEADQSSSSLDDRMGHSSSGRMKASSVLMSLFSCGSISFRDCGVTAIKDHGLSLLSPTHKLRLPRGENQTLQDGTTTTTTNVMMELENNASRSFAKMALEDKEYFSGSLIETHNKDQPLPSLQRSSSYNADRSSRLKLTDNEDGVRAKCIPRRLKTQASASKKECEVQIDSTVNENPN